MKKINRKWLQARILSCLALLVYPFVRLYMVIRGSRR